MPRIIPNLILSAAFGAFATAALAESEGATLDGHWMAIGDILGLLPGHIESLTIGEGEARSVVWRAGDCAEDPAAMACSLPIPAASGRFVGTSFDLQVVADATDAAPFAQGDPLAEVWPLLAVPGGAWQTFRQGERLMTVREGSVGGNTVPLLRIWLRVAPEVPGQLFDFLLANELSVARAICPVVSLFGEAPLWAGFTAHLAAMAGPNHDLRLWRTGLGAPEGLAGLVVGDAAAYGREAAAAFALNHGWQQGTGPVPEGLALLPGFPYPAPPALVAATADCDTRLFGG